MTKYAGEGLRLWAYGSSFTPGDKTKKARRLTGADVSAATVTVWDSAGEMKLDEVALTYDADLKDWGYIWDSDGIDAGRFKARFTFTPLSGPVSIEWGKFSLSRQPVP
jgi:hypothetical protein